MSILSRKEFKALLTEWKQNFNKNIILEKELLNETVIKKFQEKHPDFDITSFSPQLKNDGDYLSIISNSIEDDQQHNPSDYEQQFDFYKKSIEPNRNNKRFLTVYIPGGDTVSLDGKLNQGRCTATYDDIQQFQQARLETGKGNKESLKNAYMKVLEEAKESNFELVAENSDWIIFYVKSKMGSIALARSYWNGNKVTYDETFKAHQSFGQNTGRMSWCTSVSGTGNMFYKYHLGKETHHMYYCIKKNLSSINDDDRKLCISFVKSNGKVKFKQSEASVNGNNNQINEKQAKRHIRSLYNVLVKDAKQDIRLEIDEETYYKSISLGRYLSMRADHEENIVDFEGEVISILKYSKDADKILNYVVKDSNSVIRKIAASYSKTLPDDLLVLIEDKDSSVRAAAAKNSNTPPEVLPFLAEDEDRFVKGAVAGNSNTPPDTLRFLAKDEDGYVRVIVAKNSNTPPDVLLDLAKPGAVTRGEVAGNSNTHPDVLSVLAYDKEHYIRHAVADNSNTPPKVLPDLAKDIQSYVRASVAKREDLLELDPSGKIIKQLASDRDPFVRSEVASREDLLELDPSGEIVWQLASDEIKNVRDTLEYRPQYVEFLSQATNESVLKQYIKTLLN